MKESHELEDEEGCTLEDRVISSSFRMMLKGAGKNKELLHKLFLFFAVFPKGVPVPASFFNKMAPVLSNETSENKARLSVGLCLGTILKFNLIKGSLAFGQGVFMHDVNRAFVISQHSEGELRFLQKAVVDAILAARPEPDGFPTAEHAVSGSFESYVARQLYVHVRGALEENQEPPGPWLTHSDSTVRKNVTMAMEVTDCNSLCLLRPPNPAKSVRSTGFCRRSSSAVGIPLLHDTAILVFDQVDR
jgi:hypothetical protein